MNLKLKILLVIAYLYIFGILLNYQNAWMHRETAITTQKILAEHSSFQERMFQCFNWRLFEGEYGGIPNSRARIFSNMFETVNILLRNWLFKFIPPHPSLSLTWLIVLALSPYYLYKLMKNLTDDSRAALIASFVYIISPGALISIIMLFHPGKAVSNFFYIFCLYLGSQIIKDLKTDLPGMFERKFLLLVMTIIIALFFDEYSLFLFVLIPLFFPGLFLQRRHIRFTTTAYLLIPATYYAVLMLALPKLYTLTGFPGFNFFSRIEINNHFPAINPWAMVINFFLLLHDNLLTGLNAYLRDPGLSVQVTQFFSVTNHLVHDDNIVLGLSILKDKHCGPFQIIHTILFFILLIVGIAAVIRKCQRHDHVEQLNYFLRAMAALIGFTVFFSILHITNNILAGCGYYGAGFSVLFAIVLGLGFKFIFDTARWKDILTFVFLISLMINSFYNIRLLNHAWLALHYRETYWELDMWLDRYSRRDISERHFRDKFDGAGRYDLTDNSQIIYAAWKNRQNPASCRMLTASAPPEVNAFLTAELPYIK